MSEKRVLQAASVRLQSSGLPSRLLLFEALPSHRIGQEHRSVRDGQLPLASLAFLHAPWVGSTTLRIVIATAKQRISQQTAGTNAGATFQCDGLGLTSRTASP